MIKQKQTTVELQPSTQVLHEASERALDGATVENRIINYAAQTAAAKSLPFTAAEMALDCVSAAVNTICTDTISDKAIDVLISNGHKNEVCMSA